MTIYSYVIEHDLGFAPNPFHGACTLACCKPKIRKYAKEGDYILGTGSVKPRLQGHLCYWMRVDEILSFDEYWNDARFQRKKSHMYGSRYLCFGDNIYHHDGEGKKFIQSDSYHSERAGKPSAANILRDTGTTDRVLVSWEFAYWGRSGKKLPPGLADFIHKGPSHRCRFSEDRQAAFMRWLTTQKDRGFRDEPAGWQFLDRKLVRNGQIISQKNIGRTKVSHAHR